MPAMDGLDEWIGRASAASGMAMLIAPRTLGRLYGFRLSPAAVRLLGARDLMIGAGMLRQRTGWRWTAGRALADAWDGWVILRSGPAAARAAWAWRARIGIAAGMSALIAGLAAARWRTAISRRS